MDKKINNIHNNNNINNNINDKINNTNKTQLNLQHLITALDLVSELILITSQNNNENNNNKENNTQEYSNNNNLEFNNILFLNTALKNKIGISLEDNDYSHLKGEFENITNKNGICYCEVIIVDSNNNTTNKFFANGKIEEGIYIFTLRSNLHDLKDLAYKALTSLDMYLTIIEVGPEDGTYEWKHILPNKHVQKLYSNSPSSISTFSASIRTNETERKFMFDCFRKSKTDGIQRANKTKETDIGLRSTLVCYLETDPITGHDLVAISSFDLPSFMGRSRMTELTNFFENAPLMMGTLELKEGEPYMHYCNKAVADFCCLSSSLNPNLLNIKISDIRNDDSSSALVDLYVSILTESRTKNKAVVTEVFLPGPTGKFHCLQTIISTIKYDESTGYSKHSFFFVDITTQKEAEMALEKHLVDLEATVQARTLELKEKEHRFHSLVSNAPNIILSINVQGEIGYANKSFTARDPKLVGKFIHTLVEEGNELKDKIANLFETQKSFNTDVKLLETDMWLNLNAGIINSTKAIVVATDITENKQLAEKLEHALALKVRFLANMSHEVRTPLSGIIGMSRILMESGLTMDQTECASTIQHCGETLLSVINDVLDCTKLEATGLTLENVELSVYQCVEESLYTVLPAAQKKKLELILDVDPHTPYKIMGDMLRLKQILINLLNNAVKFTDTGFIMLSITATEIYGTDEWKIYITIKDTGCGVPKESQGKLFQMFSQVDSSITRRYGGTGIGLALAKRFSEMMNGDITMQSTGLAGEGSTFYVSLTATLVPFAVVSPSSVTSPKWFACSSHIFILENLLLSAEVLKKKLNGMGFMSVQLCTKTDVSESFETIKTFVTSLLDKDNTNIIVFCNMDEITPRFKYALMDYPNVSLVLMGYTRPINSETDYPPHEFLRKPIKQQSLIRLLKEIWGKTDNKNQPLHRVPSSSSLMKQNIIYPLNILVVEDNEMNQKVVRRVFQHLGYSKNIPIANHGKEALEMIEKNGLPDVILMDVQMPILDGVQTTKIIRIKYPDWPYICSMTADAFPEDRKNCLDAGMNDFLTKPIRVEQVQATLAKCFKLKEKRKNSDYAKVL